MRTTAQQHEVLKSFREFPTVPDAIQSGAGVAMDKDPRGKGPKDTAGAIARFDKAMRRTSNLPAWAATGDINAPIKLSELNCDRSK
jgi:hypothetical protein